jgi:hypothetical protein
MLDGMKRLDKEEPWQDEESKDGDLGYVKGH